MLLLIDNYDSFTYNLVHFLGELGASCEVHRNDKITTDEVLKKKPKAIVLSPGPCTPNEAGICLDLIAKAGPKVPLHGKLSTIRHFDKSVFKGLPETFQVTRYHSLIVERQSLPDCLDITAETEDGIIMGLMHKTHPVHGVQFHPESIASEQGHALLANFLTLAGMTPKKRPATQRPAA
jgi:anthranilate synthase component 2